MKGYREIHSEKDSYSEYFYRIFQARKYILPILVKDTKIKYSQTLLGMLWTILSPFLSILLYVLFFGFVFKLPIEQGPYILFVFTGYTFWNIISSVCYQSGGALNQNQDLIKRLPMPKIILPIAKSVGVWVENSVLILTTLIIALAYGHVSWMVMLTLPLLFVALFIFSTSLGVLISALTIYKKDLLHGIPLLLQMLIWFTPVFYPIQILPDFLKKIIALNPVTGYIELFRWILNLSDKISLESMISLFISVIVAIGALVYFKSREDIIVDYL